MKHFTKFFFVLFLAVTVWSPVLAQEKPAMHWKNIADWHYIRTNNNSLSPDGQWLAWSSGPTEGDLTLTVKHTRNATSYSFPIGATSTTAQFSEDGRYVAFRESMKDKDAKAARKAKKPLTTKLQLVSLVDTAKVAFERINNFSFSGENPNWLAVGLSAAEGASRGENSPRGTDLLLYHMESKTTYNVGNVSEYSFNKGGNLLAYIVDAQGQNGNGIWIRDMETGITTPVDVDKAQYKRIRWNDEGSAFALLKATKDEAYAGDIYHVIGVRQIKGAPFSKVNYMGLEDADFPAGKGISEHAPPYWSEDLNTLFFGIADLEKKPESKTTDSASTDSTKTDRANQIASRPSSGRPGASNSNSDQTLPDMIIWNWQDTRLQSAQQVQENRDKNFSYAAAYHVDSDQFVPLADQDMRSVSIGPKQIYAIGYDYRPYEVENNLSGQSHVDVYLIEIETGKKTLLLENHFQNASRTMAFAPNGQHLAYYKDGTYYSIDLKSRQHHALTTNVNASFVNAQSDHNVENPATPFMGWSEDSKFVFIRDNFDLWKISVDGKKATSLTPNWKADRLQVNGFSRIYPDDQGIDLKKDQFLAIFDDATKKAGFAILEAGKEQVKTLFLDDHSYRGFTKAKNTSHFIFTRESNEKSPEVFFASTKDLNGVQLTENTPDQDKYAWSAGVELIEFVSAHGDTLQAALYLPANYVPGQSYPTVTYIYERLTQGLNGYANPSYPGGGFNRAIYTSNGYAVLMPDIKYQLNEPGNSAVACVIPAVEAAIATGIVDPENVGIHGHSWGGYQTSFLITQTNMFKAAAAGAPLTNMISMYSLIYWNSGSTNQSIFESSQGRLTTGYWDNWDAYIRNSPIYYIKNVETPLLLLHNDKDGAVDYTQGIEYYNGLRRLNKPVTMITYKGENHGIVKEENRKDYAVRMLEFMNHYLKGEPAPDWWEKGVDHLDLKKHLEERVF